MKNSQGTVEYEVERNVAILSLNNSPVNSLSSSTREGLVSAFSRALADEMVRAIVVCGKGRAFCAGLFLSFSFVSLFLFAYTHILS